MEGEEEEFAYQVEEHRSLQCNKSYTSKLIILQQMYFQMRLFHIIYILQVAGISVSENNES